MNTLFLLAKPFDIHYLDEGVKTKKAFEKLTVCNLQVKKAMFNAQFGAITRPISSLQLYS